MLKIIKTANDKEVASTDLLSVIVISKLNPNTWDMIGDKYIVKEYLYMATIDCTINKCFCFECIKERGSKKLYKMYEVVSPAQKQGNILFQMCYEILSR